LLLKVEVWRLAVAVEEEDVGMLKDL